MLAEPSVLMDLTSRKKFVDIRTVENNPYPHRLFLKSNGVYIGAFATMLSLEKRLMDLPETTLKPKKVVRRVR